MKNLHKILLSASILLVIAAIGGVFTYKYYIVPKHIEPMLQLASEALKDSETQLMLADFADELVEEGVLGNSTAKNYIRKINKQQLANRETAEEEGALDSILTEEDIQKHFDEEKEKEAKRDNESMIVAYSSNSYLGIESIKSDADNQNSEPSSYHTYSDKQEYVKDNQSADAKAQQTQTLTQEEKNKLLYNKIMNAMNTNERSTFFSVMTKTSIAEMRELYNSGNKESIKTYLKEKLDKDTYKKAVSVFYKYAHLLYEE